MIFPCTKCGLCCKHLELIPQLKHFDLENGRCMHLTDNNLCDIYEKRPDICNVNKMYELQFCNQMTENEYIKINMECCKRIKEKWDI